ncbi:hypothetical protein BMR1_01G01255 [Babesia microti strain RI]|uniref:Uncharacterized protein n=1 Tax=Babesia microti (strain RI) TaxID=1133968 RepID=I7J5B3_BABMR|nr:hypothetical protein BMR1_01G01255 [Babesia microti strain RI]CCF72717.1 hypothetical protein BMR1_01G01255 [Babesia microti strain RI]|eukprot:XP_012647326.1 hypothetical protein BMR1_01G01255 [Babesia microti strain RI]
MDKRELLIYPVEVCDKDRANLKQNVQNPNVHLVPQTASMLNAIRTPTHAGVNQQGEDAYHNFAIKSPPTPSKIYDCCTYNQHNQNEIDQRHDGSNAHVYECKPFTFSNQSYDMNPLNTPKMRQDSYVKPDTNKFTHPQFDTTPKHSIGGTHFSRQFPDMDFVSNAVSPHTIANSKHSTSSHQQIARSQHNSLLQQYVNQQGGSTPKLTHNLSVPEEYSLNKVRNHFYIAFDFKTEVLYYFKTLFSLLTIILNKIITLPTTCCILVALIQVHSY